MKNVFRRLSKVTIMLTYCALLPIVGFSQDMEKLIDFSDPINRVELKYVNNNTRVVLALNERSFSNEDKNSLPSINEVFEISGVINWEDGKEQDKRTIKTKTLSKLDSNNPFVLFVDIQDENTNYLGMSENGNKWKNITIKLKYNIYGEVGETFNITFNPPSQSEEPVSNKIIISAAGQLKRNNQGIISFRSSNVAIGFKIESISVDAVGDNIGAIAFNENDFGSLYTMGGSINVKLDFDEKAVIKTGTVYEVTCVAKSLDGSYTFESEKTNVVFTDAVELYVTNRTGTFNLAFQNPGGTVYDENIKTKGKGLLDIEFLNSDFKTFVTSNPKVDPNDGSTYDIELIGLDNLADTAISTFYYINPEKISTQQRVSGPHLITLGVPQLTNFKIDPVKDDKFLVFSFDVVGVNDPGYFNVVLTDEDEDKEIQLQLGGSRIFENTDLDPTHYTGKIERSWIIDELDTASFNKSIKFQINSTDGATLYDLTFSIFNKSAYDKLMSTLEDQASKKKRDRNVVTIENTIKLLAKVADVSGAVIEDEEIKQAVEKVSETKGEDVVKIIGEIGKWAKIAGKIVAYI